MNKPEYSDIYKFIASLGVILISFAVFLPWLVLREPFDSHVTVSEIDELTEIAQQLIAYRQSTALWFVQNIVLFSVSLALLGLIILAGGLLLWYPKQKVLDKKDRHEEKILETEVKKMSPEQIAVKVIKETATDEQQNVDDAPFEIRQSKYIDDIQESFRIENIVIEKLTYCFGSATVLSHQKIGSSEIDVLIRLTNKVRIIVEVKRARNIGMADFQALRINETLGQVVREYKDIVPGQIVYGIGIIIISDSDAKPELVKQTTEIPTIIFRENDFLNINSAELKERIFQVLQA